MNHFKIILLTCLLIGFCIKGFTQESRQDKKSTGQAEPEPKEIVVTNNVKTGGQVSRITQKVIELADGNNKAAEKTVRYLKVEMEPPVKRIVSDAEMHRNKGRLPEGYISETEVKELINQFK